jgi:hypothetical protein
MRVHRWRAPLLDARQVPPYCRLMSLSIEKVLSSVPLVKKDGSAWIFPEEVEANAYISLGQEALQVARISRIEIGSEVIFLTHKGERYYFTAEQVVGFKFGGAESRHKLGGAGFTKL